MFRRGDTIHIQLMGETEDFSATYWDSNCYGLYTEVPCGLAFHPWTAIKWVAGPKRDNE